ncbi:gamma-glutamylcyclotransferase [Roseovarius spongiae]|uniref:Gamma-glutamylcyclotransferase n=1 Tax=Roseovarius spongiae TaxID=2320272 RepID=A0A3A8AS41_9RHOB|nr:gamma-glutamylcyclotransferase family protein [Roseovarius spongiae]RKF13942.1 gamma-glutamylcyclotransferase [Roseovarius spongiae]
MALDRNQRRATQDARHDAWFFGYGSLVNRATHAYPDAQPATLSGWRRVWRHTDLRQVAYLTVVPDADCAIDGLIAGVPGGDWKALDIREGAYDRVPADGQVRHALGPDARIAVYTIPEGKHGRPTRAHPVLLSYIDVVVQGYLREFGEAGARRFFETTQGWDVPVLNDRAAPAYPRHCALSPQERAFVDAQLAALPVRIEMA